MRILVWLALGFGAACALGAYALRGTGLLVLAAVTMVLTVAAWRLGKKRMLLRPTAVLLLGLTLGSLVFWNFDTGYANAARQADGKTAQLSLTATDFCRETEYGASVQGTIRLSGRRYQVLLYLEEPEDIRPGDRVNLTATLRFTDEGGSREPNYRRGDGILLIASRKSEPVIQTGTMGLRELPALLRQGMEGIIASCFSEDTRGFAAALLLGDKSGLLPETSLAFRLTGLSHIVAVSGLHMSVLFALVCLLLGRHRFWTPLVGAPLVLLFAAVVGFTPSVTRAAIMELLYLLALATDREYDPPNALAFAVIAMLSADPLVITSVGFQLSVASVAGIFLFYPTIRRRFGEWFSLTGTDWRKKLARGVCDALSLSISATTLSTPLAAYYFGTVSLVSLLANLLVVPGIGVVFYGVLAVCLTGAVLPGLGAALGWAVDWLVRYVLWIARTLAELPLAAVYTRSVYIIIWLVFAYLIFARVLRGWPGRVRDAALCTVLGLCLALGLSWAEPRMDDYRVTVLDVGQGQCVLLQSRGNVFLVDCGGNSGSAAGDTAAEALLSMGISRVDGLILTHFDRDHTGGVPQLALRIGVDRLYLPRSEEAEPVLNALPDAERIWLDGDGYISFGGCSIRIFAAETEKSGNESGAAVLFQSEKYDTLILSDLSAAGERRLLETGLLPELEILVVGHHGSKTSTSEELLFRTDPDIAMISVGRDNAYGHPANEVLERLTRYGCRILRTDLVGDIVFRG